MLVACDVLRTAHQNKPDLVSRLSRRRKSVALYTCNFLRLRMLVRVNDLRDSRTRHFVSGLNTPSGFRGTACLSMSRLRKFPVRTERNDAACLSTSPDVAGLLQAL